MSGPVTRTRLPTAPGVDPTRAVLRAVLAPQPFARALVDPREAGANKFKPTAALDRVFATAAPALSAAMRVAGWPTLDATFAPPQEAPKAAAQGEQARVVGKSAAPKAKRNPEQDMLDLILNAGGKWSLNQLGAAARMREAPGSPPPMKDMLLAQAQEFANQQFAMDWNKAVASTADNTPERNEAINAAYGNALTRLQNILGVGIGVNPDDME